MNDEDQRPSAVQFYLTLAIALLTVVGAIIACALVFKTYILPPTAAPTMCC